MDRTDKNVANKQEQRHIINDRDLHSRLKCLLVEVAKEAVENNMRRYLHILSYFTCEVRVNISYFTNEVIITIWRFSHIFICKVTKEAIENDMRKYLFFIASSSRNKHCYNFNVTIFLNKRWYKYKIYFEKLRRKMINWMMIQTLILHSTIRWNLQYLLGKRFYHRVCIIIQFIIYLSTFSR